MSRRPNDGFPEGLEICARGLFTVRLVLSEASPERYRRLGAKLRLLCRAATGFGQPFLMAPSSEEAQSLHLARPSRLVSTQLLSRILTSDEMDADLQFHV